jgi:hypothetical protein
MAKDSDHLAVKLGTENTGSLLTGFLAEEVELDRHALWRLGSWGAVAVGAIVVAALANQTSLAQRREQLAAADLSRQAAQLQLTARESLSETRRLASGVETLNTDRDRIYSRMTELEQGLESVTGALARQSLPAASLPQQLAAKVTVLSVPEVTPAAMVQPASPPALAPVSTTAAIVAERPRTEVAGPAPAQPQPGSAQPPSQPPSPSSPQPQMQTTAPAAAVSLPKIASNNAPATAPTEPLMASKSMMAPPDPAASKLIEPANEAPAAVGPEVAAPVSAGDVDNAAGGSARVQRIDFAVDLGSANSVGGLRALWRGITKTNTEVAALRPIIVVRERSNGLGTQLRLAAGPLSDAAAAAKICAALTESERGCETTLFDGQRLSLQAEEKPEQTPSAAPKPTMSRRGTQRRTSYEEPAAPVVRPEKPSTLSKLFGSK